MAERTDVFDLDKTNGDVEPWIASRTACHKHSTFLLSDPV